MILWLSAKTSVILSPIWRNRRISASPCTVISIHWTAGSIRTSWKRSSSIFFPMPLNTRRRTGPSILFQLCPAAICNKGAGIGVAFRRNSTRRSLNVSSSWMYPKACSIMAAASGWPSPKSSCACMKGRWKWKVHLDQGTCFTIKLPVKTCPKSMAYTLKSALRLLLRGCRDRHYPQGNREGRARYHISGRRQ